MGLLTRTELLKLWSTRTTKTLVAFALLLPIAIAGLIGLLVKEADLGSRSDLLANSIGLVPIFAVVLGILLMTAEYRWGTAASTFLSEPRRARVMMAKVLAMSLAGLALGVAAVAGTLGALAVGLTLSGKRLGFSSALWGTSVGAAAAVALFAVLGVGYGAVLKSQVGAMVSALVALVVVFPLVAQLLVSVVKLNENIRLAFPDAAAGLLTGQPAGITAAPWVGALAVGGYVVLFAVVGTALVQRRDV